MTRQLKALLLAVVIGTIAMCAPPSAKASEPLSLRSLCHDCGPAGQFHQPPGVTAPTRVSPPTSIPPADEVHDALYGLRMCESGGNYSAISPSGKYRGAYQFSFATWQAVGGAGDPVEAAPDEQDYRAWLLLTRYGPQHWPVCQYQIVW